MQENENRAAETANTASHTADAVNMADAAQGTNETGVATASVEALRRAHAQEIERLRVEGEVRVALAQRGARNIDLAARVVSLDGVSVAADGTITGVDGCVARLAQSDPYLFREAGNAGGTAASSGGRHGAARDPAQMSDAEYYRSLSL